MVSAAHAGFIPRNLGADWELSGPRVPRPCKLPAYCDSASPVFLTSHIPAAMFGGSCRERSFAFRSRVAAGFYRTDGGDDVAHDVIVVERFGGPGGVAQLGE